MTEDGRIILIVLLLLIAVAAFLAGYIPSRRASNKERRWLNAVKETLRKTPNRGPEIPGMTQIEPGLYIANKSYSILKRRIAQQGEK